MSNETNSGLGLYQSHKRVRAGKIANINTHLKDSDLLRLDNGGVIEVSKEYSVKHEPKVGGYYVEYMDGYESWSPSSAFEEGYNLIKEG